MNEVIELKVILISIEKKEILPVKFTLSDTERKDTSSAQVPINHYIRCRSLMDVLWAIQCVRVKGQAIR